MPGAPDPLYVNARGVLLDALEALGAHRSLLILVGAQAIYFHTGEADISVAPFTTDADVVIDPTSLADQPVLGGALQASGFVAGQDPGQWFKDEVRVDLMVPETIAGPGRRRQDGAAWKPSRTQGQGPRGRPRRPRDARDRLARRSAALRDRRSGPGASREQAAQARGTGRRAGPDEGQGCARPSAAVARHRRWHAGSR